MLSITNPLYSINVRILSIPLGVTSVVELARELRSLDAQYGLAALMSDKFKEAKNPANIIASAVAIYKSIPEEIGILMFRLMKQNNPKAFLTHIRENKEALSILEVMSSVVLAGK